MKARVDPKFAVPQAHSHEVNRVDLLERLEANEKSLVLVVAPAGYGKSTLIAQFARATSRAATWVNLSSEESEALLLGRSIAQAVHTALPNATLSHWERAVSLDASTEQLAVGLAADLNLLSDDLILILETLEHLSEESGRWLTAFLQRLGEGHQVITSFWDWNEGVVVDFSRFIADGRALVINQDDLAFSLEETETLFVRVDSGHDAQAVWKAVDGWPAALGMILHGAPLSGTPQDLIRGILRNLPEATRSALPEAAVLTTWSEAEAARLKLNLPAMWLQDVQRSGLPVQVLEGRRYQPHKVLLNTLDEMLSAQPERHAHLHIQAARLAETNGDLITAVLHFRIAAQFEEAQRILDELLPRYQRRSEWMLIRKLLEPFPINVLSPYALTMLGIAFIETQAPDVGNRILNEQLEQGKAVGATYFGLALLSYRQGALDEVVTLVDKGLSVSTKQRDTTELLRIKSLVLFQTNREEEGIAAIEEVIQWAEKNEDAGILAHALSIQQHMLSVSNRHEESLVVGLRAIRLATQRGVPNKAMSAIDSYASTLWRMGRAYEALPVVEEFLHRIEDYPLAKPFMLNQRANIYEQLGQYELALEDYKSSSELFFSFQNTALAIGNVVDCADMLMFLGRDNEAEIYVSKAKSLVSKEDLSGQRAIERSEGKLFFARGGFNQAEEIFYRNYQYSKQEENFLLVVMLKGYLLQIAERKGELTKRFVNELIDDLNDFGYDWPLQQYANEWQNLYRVCISNGWCAERFEPYLEAQMHRLPHSNRLKLELSLLGGFSAQVDGCEVTLSSRPQEVLAYLALHGRTRIDVLASAIWPDATLRSAKRNLAQQIRALRETLTQSSETAMNPLATENGAYKLSDNLEVHSDVERLEKAVSSTSDDEKMQAVRSYQGELLPHLQSEWVLSARLWCEMIAASLALALARKKEQESMEVAAKLYEKAVQIDPFLQEAHEGLAATYENLANPAAALHVRQKWKKIEESINPS